MRTNILTPITERMRETLPDGYAIYGNGCDEFKVLVEKARSPKLIRWLGQPTWSEPCFLVGNADDLIYAVPINSKLHSLLCEDEPHTREVDHLYTIEILERELNRLMRKSDQYTKQAMKIEDAIETLSIETIKNNKQKGNQ